MLIVLAAALTLLQWAPPAAAADDTAAVLGAGQDQFTKQWFDEIFEVALPDINDSGLGKAQFRVRFETDTEAALTTSEQVRVEERNHGADSVIGVRAHRRGDGRLAITTRPAIRINVDYEPQDADAFECDMNHTRQTGPGLDFGDVYEPVPGQGDGDGTCGYLEVTASDIGFLLGEPVSDEFTLIDRLFTLPKDGDLRFERDEELFEIKVCKMLSQAFPALGILGDRCAFKVIGLASADLVVPEGVNGEPAGMYATHELCGRPIAGGAPIQCGLSTAASMRFVRHDPVPDVVHYPPVCPTIDHELHWRLRDVGYRVQVKDVNLGVRVDFNARLRNRGDGITFTIIEFPPTGEHALRLLRDLDGVDHVLEIDARNRGPQDQDLRLRIGMLGRDVDPPTVDLGSPLRVLEGGTTELAAQPTGPGGRVDNCTPASDIGYEWHDGDLFDPIAEITVGDNTHALPVPEGPATETGSLVVRDAGGNAATDQVDVDVVNVAPTATLTAPADNTVVRVGTSVTFSAEALDPGVEDLLTYRLRFGDGTAETAATLQRRHSTTHAYTAPCICTATLEVADDDGGAAPTETAEIVAVDPRAGKLTGGAKFIADSDSIGLPPGSIHDLNATVQYETTGNVPKGMVDLDARLSGISVRSTSLAFLVVTPTRAVVDGNATLNGAPGYSFRLDLATGPDGRATAMRMDLWRPGVTSLQAPHLRASGPLDIGLMKTH